MFQNTNSVNLCQNSVFANCRGIKNEVSEKKIACFVFVFLCCWKRNRIKEKKQIAKRPQNPIKKVLRWSSKTEKNGKILSFFSKIDWHYLCQERRKTCIFVHTICFGQTSFWPKTVKTRKKYNNSGFSGNCLKPKMTPSLKKVFLGWVKKCFLLTAFLKSCVLLKTLFW